MSSAGLHHTLWFGEAGLERSQQGQVRNTYCILSVLHMTAPSLE